MDVYIVRNAAYFVLSETICSRPLNQLARRTGHVFDMGSPTFPWQRPTKIAASTVSFAILQLASADRHCAIMTSIQQSHAAAGPHFHSFAASKHANDALDRHTNGERSLVRLSEYPSSESSSCTLNIPLPCDINGHLSPYHQVILPAHVQLPAAVTFNHGL